MGGRLATPTFRGGGAASYTCPIKSHHHGGFTLGSIFLTFITAKKIHSKRCIARSNNKIAAVHMYLLSTVQPHVHRAHAEQSQYCLTPIGIVIKGSNEALLVTRTREYSRQRTPTLPSSDPNRDQSSRDPFAPANLSGPPSLTTHHEREVLSPVGRPLLPLGVVAIGRTGGHTCTLAVAAISLAERRSPDCSPKNS